MQKKATTHKRFAGTIRRFATIATIAVFIYIFLSLISAHFFTHSVNRKIDRPSPTSDVIIEDVRFLAADNIEIAGWFLPGSAPGKAVILLHGYNTDRREMLTRAHWLNSLGYSVLLYDARGHGESAATRRSIGYYETNDLRGAISYLRTRRFSDLAVIGISQGAATTIMAADALDELKCIVLESPYTNARDAIDRRFRYFLGIPGWPAAGGILTGAEFLLSLDVDSISPLHRIGDIKPPKLILSGIADRRTWVSDIKRLYDAAQGEKEIWLIPGALHQDLLAFDKAGYQQTVGAFLEKHFPVNIYP